MMSVSSISNSYRAMLKLPGECQENDSWGRKKGRGSRQEEGGPGATRRRNGEGEGDGGGGGGGKQ